MEANERTENGESLATPVLDQPSSGRLLKNEIVASRTFLNSSTSSAHDVLFACADPTARSWSKLGSASANPRANQNARKRKTRSPSLTWFRTSRIVHFPGA